MKLRPFVPMSPILTAQLPKGEQWLYQLKWDGYRIVAHVDDGSARLYSKTMLSKNKPFPELVYALSRLKGSFVLDGEAVILDEASGKPSFQRLQQRDKLSDSRLITAAALQKPVQYILFDLLAADGNDLRPRPLTERLALLTELVESWGESETFFLADSFADGDRLWEWVAERGWEGVVAKRKDSQYAAGKDHADWFKRKTALRIEAEAVGILIREGRIASLAVRRNGIIDAK